MDTNLINPQLYHCSQILASKFRSREEITWSVLFLSGSLGAGKK